MLFDQKWTYQMSNFILMNDFSMSLYALTNPENEILWQFNAEKEVL